MKTMILLAALACCTCGNAQSTSTSPAVQTPTGNSGQGTAPYNGTNPSGQPNQIPGYSVNPAPYQPLTPTISPANPQPNNTSPIQPNTTSPVTPATPVNPYREK